MLELHKNVCLMYTKEAFLVIVERTLQFSVCLAFCFEQMLKSLRL